MEIFDSPAFWLNFSRLLILLFTGLIAWVTYRTHLLLKEIQPEFNVLLSLPETIGRLGLVGVCLFLVWLTPLSGAELGLSVSNFWRSVCLGLVIGVIFQMGVYLITQQALKYFGANIYSPWLIQNILPQHSREWLLVPLALLPAVAMEELLFRTLLIGAFQSIIPLPILIVGTSLVFGFMHQPQGKLGMIMAGGINILFCILFVWSGELLITLIVHYVINMLQIIAAYFQRDKLRELAA